MSAHVVRGMITGMGLAGALVVGGGTVAQATVRHVGGGTWDYGVATLWPATNWSYYHHSGVKHGSTVTGDYGCERSVCVPRGTWSLVTAWDSNPFRIDHAYWRLCRSETSSA